MHAIGVLDHGLDDVDDIERVRRLPSPQLAGTPDRSTLDLNALCARGVRLVGRLAGVRDRTAQFSGSLRNACRLADLKMNRLLAAIDEWVAAQGLDGEIEPRQRFAPTHVESTPQLQLDLGTREIQSVVWATGYQPDYRWLGVPVVDGRGLLRHHLGGRRCVRAVCPRFALSAPTQVDLHPRRPGRRPRREPTPAGLPRANRARGLSKTINHLSPRRPTTPRLGPFENRNRVTPLPIRRRWPFRRATGPRPPLLGRDPTSLVRQARERRPPATRTPPRPARFRARRPPRPRRHRRRTERRPRRPTGRRRERRAATAAAEQHIRSRLDGPSRPTSMLTEQIGDGHANCLEDAATMARPLRDEIVFMDDRRGAADGNANRAGHTLVRDRATGRVWDPTDGPAPANPQAWTYRSVDAWTAAQGPAADRRPRLRSSRRRPGGPGPRRAIGAPGAARRPHRRHRRSRSVRRRHETVRGRPRRPDRPGRGSRRRPHPSQQPASTRTRGAQQPDADHQHREHRGGDRRRASGRIRTPRPSFGRRSKRASPPATSRPSATTSPRRNSTKRPRFATSPATCRARWEVDQAAAEAQARELVEQTTRTQTTGRGRSSRTYLDTNELAYRLERLSETDPALAVGTKLVLDGQLTANQTRRRQPSPRRRGQHRRECQPRAAPSGRDRRSVGGRRQRLHRNRRDVRARLRDAERGSAVSGGRHACSHRARRASGADDPERRRDDAGCRRHRAAEVRAGEPSPGGLGDGRRGRGHRIRGLWAS